MRTPCDERTKCLVRQICDQSQHSSKTFRSEARCSKHCTVKENASDKISDYLTEITNSAMLLPSWVFKITGFVCKYFLPFSPSVPQFALTPLFPQPKHPSHLSSIFLGSKTPQKLLLRWLAVSRLFQTLISTSSILPSVVCRSKQN